MKPVAGTIALIERVASFRAYDYAVRIIEEQTNAQPVRDEAWELAVRDATDALAASVAARAYHASRLNYAEAALRSAAHDGMPIQVADLYK